ncbi:hypothetical protein CR513_40965, partial [Mucuna pruriens]
MQALSILPVSNSFLNFDDSTLVPARLDPNFSVENQIHNANEEDVEEQEDFSFPCIDPQGTLIFADEIFDNGKIRPIFPIFDQSLIFTTAHDNDTLPLRLPLKKVFIKQLNDFPSKSKGLHNKTAQKTMVEVIASNDKSKKSNSMGFSKTWTFREDLKLRSNSDGDNAFVLLNPSGSVPIRSSKVKENVVSKKGNDGKCKIALSAHEKLYVMNRKKKENICT